MILTNVFKFFWIFIYNEPYSCSNLKLECWVIAVFSIDIFSFNEFMVFDNAVNVRLRYFLIFDFNKLRQVKVILYFWFCKIDKVKVKFSIWSEILRLIFFISVSQINFLIKFISD